MSDGTTVDVTFFNCPICLDTAQEPVESECCHQLFCTECAGKVVRDCPQCRRPFQTRPSILARRILASMPVRCEKCAVETNHEAIGKHLAMCPQAQYVCVFAGCAMRLESRRDYFDHLESHHPGEVIDMLQRRATPALDIESRRRERLAGQRGFRNGLFTRPNIFGSSTSRTRQPPLARDWDNNIILPCFISSVALPDRKATNSGVMSRRGDTGKYYCGRELGFRCCGSCDGVCGPNNGCNCVECMELDVATLMLPCGYLVNRDGRVTRRMASGFVCGETCTQSEPCFGCHALNQTGHYRRIYRSDNDEQSDPGAPDDDASSDSDPYPNNDPDHDPDHDSDDDDPRALAFRMEVNEDVVDGVPQFRHRRIPN